MGSRFNIKCKNCDYSKEFTIGIGFIYSPSNLMNADSKSAMLLKLINSSRAYAKVKTLIEVNKAELADNYGHKVYRCRKCGEFYGKFFIHLDYDGGSYEVEYKCPSCRTVLEPIGYEDDKVIGWGDQEINLEQYPCPKCGKHSLHENQDGMMMWD